MPYPNNNPYNIVISQTSGSSVNSQYPFVETIISGSNLFIVTDANGLLTASTFSPTSSVAISASYALTASFSQTVLSASFSQTALSASFSQTALTASFSQTVLSASFSQTSSVSLLSNVNKINDNNTYYVTFVNNTGSNVGLKTDSDVLSYNPASNALTLGNTSASLFIGFSPTTNSIVNANAVNIYSYQYTASGEYGGIAGLEVGSSLTNKTASFSVGSNNQFLIVTGQPAAGVYTSLVTTNTNTTNNDGLTYNNGALQVEGGVGIGKNLFVNNNLYVKGSTFLYGDLTIYGTGSIVNISSSTVIIGDNRIQLNAGVPIQRYAGIDVFDSGSGTFTNNVTSSLLWDGLNDNWLLVSNNQKTGNPLTQSSAIMIGGPSGSFGVESLLTVNYIPKAQSTGKNLQNSSLIDTGTVLTYAGTGISASQITTSQLTVQYTGSITYATGVYITYTTGSFTTITITTGSNPGVGSQVPATPTASGMAGQINVDNNFIYVYTNQIWKRVPLSTWSV